jgi:putative transposase
MEDLLDSRWSRDFTGTPTTVTVSRDGAGRYFASFLVEEEVATVPVVDSMVGVGVGLKDIAVRSTGEKIANPKHLRPGEQRLRHAQRNRAHTQKKSKNREKARLKVAHVHVKVADQRRDRLQNLTTRWICENHVIGVESLAVTHLMRTPPLAKASSDAAWGAFVHQLTYKDAWYGRTLVAIDKWYPSTKRCSACGQLLASRPPYVRQWRCPACGTAHDRDVHAATNMLAAGLAAHTCGEAGRPGRAMLPSGSPQ